MADRWVGSSSPISSQAAAVFPEAGSLDGSSRLALARPVEDLFIPDDLAGCSRLVVLIPPEVTPDVGLAQYIWRVALALRAEVLYLSVARAGEAGSGSTHLASLSAMTRDGALQVETRVVAASGWVEALEAIVQPGDVVLGHAEQRLPTGLFQARPLVNALASTLPVPVYTLSGYIPKEGIGGLRSSPRMLAWALLILILVVFLVADDNVIYFLKGSAQQILLFGLLIVEMALIWFWDAKMR